MSSGPLRGVMALAAAALAGCYSYEPLTTPTPAPGVELAATLTDSGSAVLAGLLGAAVTVVRGRYGGAPEGGGGVRLSVDAVETARGDEIAWAGEQVTLPSADIATLSVRRFSKGRSALLAGVGVAGLAALVEGFHLIGSGSVMATTGNPPPPK